MDKMMIYNALPVWGQNLACYAEGQRIVRTRYNERFRKALLEYEKRDAWSYDRLCEYRDKRIRRMVKHCYSTVPYYNKLFYEGGIAPESIRTIDDLKKLPILNKEIVNQNPEMFLSSAVSQKERVTAHTSGTTGAGFIFKTTQQAQCEQWAVWWRYRRRLGIKFGTVSANFGTRFVVPVNQTRPPFWRYNRPCHQIYFSAFHEKPEYLKYYIQEIIRKHVTWIHGYPSLITELADEVIREKVNLGDQMKFVTIGAENLLEHQASIIKRAFGVHVYQHYGLSEGVANFSEYPDQKILVDEDFAAVEFVEEEGTTRIIGTNLTNYAMPLLRWDTKDTAEAEEHADRGRVVTSIDGRIEDYISLPDGRKIGKLDHIFKDAVHLKEVQIKQNRDYKINVLIVPRDSNYQTDLKLAAELFRQTLGADIKIEFKPVGQIEKSKSGKLRFIVSEVK